MLCLSFLWIFSLQYGEGTTVVNGVGSKLPDVVIRNWIKGYRQHMIATDRIEKVEIFYKSTSSGDGICTMLGQCKGSRAVQFGGSDMPLSWAEEKTRHSLGVFPILATGIAIVYNIKGKIGTLNLTRETLADIAIGRITKFTDPVLTAHNPELVTQQPNKNENISIVLSVERIGPTRLFTDMMSSIDAEWSGRYGTFDEPHIDTKTGAPTNWPPEANLILVANSYDVMSTVMNRKGSLGYMTPTDAAFVRLPVANLRNQQKVWLGQQQILESVRDAVNASVPEILRNLTANIVDSEMETAWPLSLLTYHIIDLNTPADVSCEAVAEYIGFITWALTSEEARTAVEENSFVPMPKEIVHAVTEEVLKKATCRGTNVYTLYQEILQLEARTKLMAKVRAAGLILLSTVVAALGALGIAGRYYVLHGRKAEEVFNVSGVLINAKNIQLQSVIVKHIPCKLHEKTAMASQLLTLSAESNISARAKRKAHKLVGLADRNAALLRPYGFAQVEAGIWYCIFEAPSKGTLHEILHSDKTYLDQTLRTCLVQQVVNGLTFLHNHGIVHGLVSLGSCHVDVNYSLKVGDWLHMKIARENGDERGVLAAMRDLRIKTLGELSEANFKENVPLLATLYCLDPEQFQTTKVTKANDAYSCGIISCLIFGEHLIENYIHKHFVERQQIENIARDVPTMPHALLGLVRSTISKNPAVRAPVSVIQEEMREKGLFTNKPVVEILIAKLEQYVNHLEDMVEAGIKEAATVNDRMEQLLSSLLPPSIASELTRGVQVQPANYECVTVMQSDIVGFTTISSKAGPEDVVVFLNGLYGAFDKVVSDHDAYKVETVGDAYIVASGLPRKNGSKHAAEILKIAAAAVDIADNFTIAHLPEKELQIRVGVATGSVVAGIVGNKSPRYCLFGNAVFGAGILEQNGKPQHIRGMKATIKTLAETDSMGLFETEPAGDIDIPSIGEVATVWISRPGDAVKSMNQDD